MFPLEEIRMLFPILKEEMNGHPLVYLDTAATAQKPQVVIDAISDFYARSYASVHRGAYTLSLEASERYAGVRSGAKAFFRTGQDHELIFTRGTTDGINLVAHSFTEAFLKPGDEIVILSTEHHSNIVPWQLAAKRMGFTLRAFSGEIDDLVSMLSEKTRLVALAHVSNSTGAVHPVEEICQLCRSRGIYTLVDGAQSAAHLPVDLERMAPDFFVASAHKMYGPTGLGVLVGRKELFERMEPLQGGGDMIEHVGLEHSTWAKPPLRFEAGTPMIAQVIGFGAALGFLSEIGLDKIHERESEILDYLVKRLSSIEGLRITTHPKKRSSLVAFEMEGMHSLDVATLLDTRGICVRSGHLCAQPALEAVHHVSSLLRASVGIYTSEKEIDLLVDALVEVRELLIPTALLSE